MDEDHAEEYEHHRKHRNVTMVEFYDYRLQHRDTDGIVLLWGDRLRQQYIVDVCAVVEQNHLRYLCLNKTKLCADIYQGLQDTIVTNDNSVAAIKHRIILPFFSQEVHVTWFKIIKMPWQSVDGPIAQMRLLHSLAIPNGLRSKERCCPNSNLRIDRIW